MMIHNTLVWRLMTCGLTFLMTTGMSAQSVIWSPAKHMTSSTVSTIVQDDNGYIWVGTEYGLNRYDGYRYTYYLSDPHDSCTISDNCVTALYTDPKGTLWVGSRHGLQYYNPDTDLFSSVHFGLAWQPRVMDLCAGEDGSLWCATSGYGLWHMVDGKVNRVLCAEPEKDNVFYQSIAFDHNGHLWKGDQQGTVSRLELKSEDVFTEALRYDSPFGTVLKILPTTGDSIYVVCQHGLVCYNGSGFEVLADVHDRMIFASATLRSDGELVLGTMGQGLWRYTGEKQQPLERVFCMTENIDVSAASIRALFEDKAGNLWSGCYQRGLLLLPVVEPLFQIWSLSEIQRPSSSELNSFAPTDDGGLLLTLQAKGLFKLTASGVVKSYTDMADAHYIYRDRKGNYWVANSHGLVLFDLATEKSKVVLPIAGANVRAMTSDKQGRIYLSNYGNGLVVYDPVTGKDRQFDMSHPVNDDASDCLCNDWVLDLLTDSRGNIWCATASGVCCYDPRIDTFCPFGWSVLNAEHLCQCLSEDADGNILVGTNDGVYVYDQRTRQLTETSLEGLELMSRSVCGIVTTPDHTAWLSTSRGIWCYDQQLGTLQSYAHVEGLESHEYNQGVSGILPDGRVVFGLHDGLVSFDPSLLTGQHYQPSQAVLSAFVMENKVVKPGDMSGGKVIFDRNVTKAHEFELSYEDNSFVMEFSSMKFDLSNRPQLQYSVDGGRWQDAADKSNVIPFNHLQPGEYHIRVRAACQDVYSPESDYVVRIRQPWYATWWMQTLYCILLLAFVGVCFLMWLHHKRTQIEDDKMKLLIDATHDIRTPLTLILSPLHQLSERYQGEPDTARKLQTIDHNARRILKLVNQILDVRRYDKNQMPYNPQDTDLVRLINDNLQGFLYEAQQHNIKLSFRHEMEDSCHVSIDRTQFEKVIVNLIGNALKFTRDGGEIDVHLSKEGTQAVLRVSDTGVGVPNGEYERIFHRFYQVSTDEGGEGTGIGLNLCLKIMQQHGGTISASARPDGAQGSVFTVKLPMQESPVAESESAPVRQPSRSQRILLVDDDEEITNYIATELSGRYHFQVCHNGLEALQLLLADSTRFDVLVSDILMPEMDGLTMLRSIKSNSQIAHIPVVLLTSKSEMSSRLEALSAGADAFMAKPFVIDELRATIDGLIANTQRHRNKFGGSLEAAKAATEQAADVVKNNLTQDSDGKLLGRIVRVVNEHLSDSDFGVDELCLEVGVSRSQLHRKMKELTGIGAGEFIRNIRLEQAARMLKETDMNVSQVAYAVGFSNLGHFSKIFRTHFGAYPSDYGE